MSPRCITCLRRLHAASRRPDAPKEAMRNVLAEVHKPEADMFVAYIRTVIAQPTPVDPRPGASFLVRPWHAGAFAPTVETH